jgi:hypothetical protein
MIGVLVTVILFPLVGWSIGRRSIGEAFLFGAGLIGSILFLAGVLHLPLVAALVVVGVWGVGCGVWKFTRASRAARSQQPSNSATGQHSDPATQQPSNQLPRPTPHLPLPTILMLIPLVALTFVAAITPLSDFDGRAFWVLKAKGIADERSIDGPFFRGATLDPRNHYPLLIPLDGAVIFGIAHDLDDRQVRWLYLGFLVALALLVRERIGRLVSPSAGAWCAALLVWIPQFAVQPEGGVLSAYSDIAIAAFAAGAFFEMVAWSRGLAVSGRADTVQPRDPATSQPRDLAVIRFGLWLAFLVLTKSEGLPFALVFLAIGAFVFRKRIAVPAIMAGVAAGALLFWRMRIPAGDEEDIVRMLPTIPEKLQRLGVALVAFPRHMLLMPHWGVFWIAVVIAALLAVRVDRLTSKIAISVIVSMLAVYGAVYVATAWVVSDLIAVTADRLLMHVIAPSLFLLALSVSGAERQGTNPG